MTEVLAVTVGGVRPSAGRKTAGKGRCRRRVSRRCRRRSRPWWSSWVTSKCRSQQGEAVGVVGSAGGGSPSPKNGSKGWRRRWKTDPENTVTGGYCGGSGSDHGYGRIARREVVTGVLVRWSGARRRLTGGESKWRRRKSEIFKIIKPWKSMGEIKMVGRLRSRHVARSGRLSTHGLVGPTYGYTHYRYGGKFGSRPSKLETYSSREIDSIGGNWGKNAKWASNTELNQTGPTGA